MEPVLLLLTILAVDWLALVSPGPNFLLVTQAAVQRSRAYAMAVAFGVATGSLAWCLATALGLSTLFGIVPWLHGILKILGGAYLIYLGIALWRSAGQQAPMQACAPAASSRGAFRRGFLVNLLNPKSAAYYGSVFAMFMGQSTPGWVQIAAIALITLGSVLWHTALALVFSTAGMQRTYAAVWRPINRLGGILMTALGARLVLARD